MNLGPSCGNHRISTFCAFLLWSSEKGPEWSWLPPWLDGRSCQCSHRSGSARGETRWRRVQNRTSSQYPPFRFLADMLAREIYSLGVERTRRHHDAQVIFGELDVLAYVIGLINILTRGTLPERVQHRSPKDWNRVLQTESTSVQAKYETEKRRYRSSRMAVC